MSVRIEGSDVLKVVEAIVPLYATFTMGYIGWVYGSDNQTNAHQTFSKLFYYFVLPFLTFKLTSHIDPSNINICFLAADFISKFIILVFLALWATYYSEGNYDWSITCFSLSSITNSLILGVPVFQVLFDQNAVDLVVQGSAFQAIVWLTGLLFIFEHRGVVAEEDMKNDVEGAAGNNRASSYQVLKRVLIKLAKNPNSYGCIIGLVWAIVAKWCVIKMPRVIENSVGIMSNMGPGIAMIDLGIFMAMQERFIACGAMQAIIGMVLKFIVGPAAMTIASLAMRLHGDVLRVAILQAAIPVSITSFIFATQYRLHENVLSTAVIFGAFVYLPVLVVYHVILIMYASS